MGRRPINRVRCPRCKKVGTLRIKQGYSVVVSHYDRKKALQGRGKGMRHHYIGSLRYDIDKIVRPYQDQLSQTNFAYSKVALRRLKEKFTGNELKKIIEDSEVSRFVELIDELRKLKRLERPIRPNVEKQWLHWHIRCEHCQQPFYMYATFTGVLNKQNVAVHYRREAELSDRVYMQTEPRKRK